MKLSLTLMCLTAFTISSPQHAEAQCCGAQSFAIVAGVTQVRSAPVEIDKDQQQDLLETAKNAALAIAGGEMNAEYYREFQESALKLKAKYYKVRRQSLYTRMRSLPGVEQPVLEPVATPFALFRSRYGDQVAEAASLTNDPTWQENFRKWLEQPHDDPLRIFGGTPAATGEFPECVAVGNDFSFCCSGTLIGPNVVVTAAHCVEGGCTGRVYFGNTSIDPSSGKVVQVKKSIAHADYNPFTSKNDIAILILEESITDVTPAAIASSDDVEDASFVQLAGFGLTEFGTAGVKMKVEVVIATPSCCESDEQDKFGCHKDLELVAGGNGLDSCNGDSGGPAYVMLEGRRLLAGATSRATRNFTQPCGEGGIYTRVDQYLDWIKEQAAANGGVLAD